MKTVYSPGGVNAADKYHRFCYLDTMAQLRQGAGRFTLNDLHDVTLCTHLVFVHAEVDSVNYGLVPALQDDIGKVPRFGLSLRLSSFFLFSSVECKSVWPIDRFPTVGVTWIQFYI